MPRLTDQAPRIAAIGVLLIFSAVVLTAHNSTFSSGALLVRVDLCEEHPCVSWVMPAGKAWDQGARLGMKVLSVDDIQMAEINADALPLKVLERAELQSQSGEVLQIRVVQHAIGQSPMKFSVWALGAMFAVMGALVLLRRPDLHAARVFGLFATATALALAVAPSSGGPGPQWALIVQVVALVCVGLLFLPLAFALVESGTEPRRIPVARLSTALGFLILVGYAASVAVASSLYEWVRPAMLLYVSLSIVGAIATLAIRGLSQVSIVHRRQVRTALFGIALSTLPFVALTLVPESLGQKSLLPTHLSILTWGIMPVFFAYAILQHQMLGIRRLVHRGIVYWVTSMALLAVISLSLSLIVSITQGGSGQGYSLSVVLATLVVGIALFFPLKAGVRWLVNKMIYSDSADYRTLVNAVREDLLSPHETGEVAARLTQGLARGLNLESVLLFLKDETTGLRLVAGAGERSNEVADHMGTEIQSRTGELLSGGLADLRWESDSLLVAPLVSGESDLGIVLLGPARGGEVFIDEEKQVIASIVPVLALAIDKSRLSEELREINQHVVQTEEEERARIARDIHDGPLQKAMLIARTVGSSTEDSGLLARQLAAELREVCSRLRPAILDDLGLVPALDWLLEGVARQSGLSTRLELNGVDEEERFPPEVELALFRVTQEATNNAMKHARGTSLMTSLTSEDHTLVLRVVDDGVGFSQDSRKRSGFGISGMHERVSQLDGKLEVQSVPGLGTTVVARILVPKNESRKNKHELAY